MVIVFVDDNFLNKTDGTSISAHRFREELIKLGHTVRVLAVNVAGPDMYGLPENHIPITSFVARKNSMHFAKYNKRIVTEALTGADIVHVVFPWHLERKCYKLACRMGIPVSGAFHCQPENVTYNLGLRLLDIANTFVYFLFRAKLYGKLENIHCPSAFIAGELKKHAYHARLHVISNGVSGYFKPREQREPGAEKPGDTINLLMIGRLAEEKRQDLIIKAVKHSKYRGRIQLFFAGKGPMQKRYERLSAGLPHKPVFAFLSQEQLREQIYKTDIYIHASDAEIEGISCIEALACGKVPIISDSKKSATSQFALDNRSLFKKGDYLDLRDKLDYWIEHPEERNMMETEYAKLGEQYHIRHSVVKLEKMFEETIHDFKLQKQIREDKKIREYNSRLQRNNLMKEFFCRVFYFVIALPLLVLLNKFYFGLKIKNKTVLKRIRKTGAVTICNHVHEMDSTICAVGIPTRKLIYVSQPGNFNLNIAGIFVDILGSVPTPSTPKELGAFIYTLSKALRHGRVVHFYPEGELEKYDRNLRPFQRGAFYLAQNARVPVLPMKIMYRKPDGLLKFFRKKPCFTLVFGEPIYPNYNMKKPEAINDIQDRAEAAMYALTG